MNSLSRFLMLMVLMASVTFMVLSREFQAMVL